MEKNVYEAILEACGEKIVAQKAFNERCMEHIEHLVETTERMHKELGELRGRDNEGIKAECEAIAKGEDTVCDYSSKDDPCEECEEDNCDECEYNADENIGNTPEGGSESAGDCANRGCYDCDGECDECDIGSSENICKI